MVRRFGRSGKWPVLRAKLARRKSDMPPKQFRKMIGVGQPHCFTHFGNQPRVAEQALTRLLQLPPNHMAFRGHTQVGSK